MDIQLAALTLAAHLQIDSDQLLAYMREGEALPIGGYHYYDSENHSQVAYPIDGLNHWPSGSIFAVEGVVLYALIRYFKFERIAELGGFWGCSATWMAAATRANDGRGGVFSVDSGALGAQHGAMIPDDLWGFRALIASDGENWLNDQPDQSLHLVFEDADHGTETSRRLALAAMPKIANGGLYIVHDAGHDMAILGDGRTKVAVNEGAEIRAGLDAAKLDYRVYLVEPSDCGIAVVKVKHTEMDASPVVEINSIETPIENILDDNGETVINGEKVPVMFRENMPILTTSVPKKTRKPRTAKAK